MRTEGAPIPLEESRRQDVAADRARALQASAPPIPPLTHHERALLIAFAAHVQLNDQGTKLMFHQADYGFLTADGRHISAAKARAFWLLEAAACVVQ